MAWIRSRRAASVATAVAVAAATVAAIIAIGAGSADPGAGGVETRAPAIGDRAAEIRATPASRVRDVEVPRREFSEGAAESLPVSRPATRPAPPEVRVRGKVASPRTPRLVDGVLSPGVRDGGATLSTARFRQDGRRSTSVHRAAVVPIVDASGRFETLLPAGLWRLIAEHTPDPSASPPLREAWCAIFETGERDVDLGEHFFSPVVTSGVVVDAERRPLPKTPVMFADYPPRPNASPFSGAGAELVLRTDDEGRFEFAYSRFEIPTSLLLPVAPDVADFYGDGVLQCRDRIVRGVRLGSHVEMVVGEQGPAATTFVVEADVGASLRLTDGRAAASATLVAESRKPDGFFHVKLALPAGPWRLELAHEGRFYGRALQIVPGRDVRVVPTWGPARSVEGRVDATTEILRLSDPADPASAPLQRIVATGEWRLEGLPPEGEIGLLVGARYVKVPARTPATWRVE